MLPLCEDKTCYLALAQREILMLLLAEPTVAQHFFLTGGTALSVFYLHHRYSNDLDLFTRDAVNLDELNFMISRKWPNKCAAINKSPSFLSYLIDETKVDFVIDPLSDDEERPVFVFENEHRLRVDTLEGIVSNKLCACVSRSEPKDYIDLYAILQQFPSIAIESVYARAKRKEGMFDDPPTAAFQLEESIAFLKKNSAIFPALRIPLQLSAFFEFYERLAQWLYQQFTV